MCSRGVVVCCMGGEAIWSRIQDCSQGCLALVSCCGSCLACYCVPGNAKGGTGRAQYTTIEGPDDVLFGEVCYSYLCGFKIWLRERLKLKAHSSHGSAGACFPSCSREAECPKWWSSLSIERRTSPTQSDLPQALSFFACLPSLVG